VLVGVGAFQMTGMELGNCRRYGWDPIVVVFNNRSWGMLRAFDPGAGFNELADWHYSDLAAPLGGLGMRVRTRRELFEALERAHRERGRFCLIDVELERTAMSPMLERFVSALDARRNA
jgi:indolepyruvate decarboxylase